MGRRDRDKKKRNKDSSSTKDRSSEGRLHLPHSLKTSDYSNNRSYTNRPSGQRKMDRAPYRMKSGCKRGQKRSPKNNLKKLAATIAGAHERQMDRANYTKSRRMDRSTTWGGGHKYYTIPVKLRLFSYVPTWDR